MKEKMILLNVPFYSFVNIFEVYLYNGNWNRGTF